MKKNIQEQIIFEVTQETDGGYTAECLTESIFTEADTWENLRKNVWDAVQAYFFDQSEKPSSLRLHLVKDEILIQP